jgi:3-oxoacyl-[acyl-carrier protein] reductase
MTADVAMFARPDAGPDPYDTRHAANLVRWLCGPDAEDVTGQVLLVVGRRVGVIGPIAVHGRAVLEHDWAPADLTNAKSALFGKAGPGLPGHADLS